MIVQLLLDFVSSLLAGMVSLTPDLPPEFDTALDTVNDGIAYFMAQVAPLSMLVPFDALAAVVSVAVVALGVWAAVLVVRVGLWLTSLWG